MKLNDIVIAVMVIMWWMIVWEYSKIRINEFTKGDIKKTKTTYIMILTILTILLGAVGSVDLI